MPCWEWPKVASSLRCFNWWDNQSYLQTHHTQTTAGSYNHTTVFFPKSMYFQELDTIKHSQASAQMLRLLWQQEVTLCPLWLSNSNCCPYFCFCRGKKCFVLVDFTRFFPTCGCDLLDFNAIWWYWSFGTEFGSTDLFILHHSIDYETCFILYSAKESYKKCWS